MRISKQSSEGQILDVANLPLKWLGSKSDELIHTGT